MAPEYLDQLRRDVSDLREDVQKLTITVATHTARTEEVLRHMSLRLDEHGASLYGDRSLCRRVQELETHSRLIRWAVGTALATGITAITTAMWHRLVK